MGPATSFGGRLGADPRSAGVRAAAAFALTVVTLAAAPLPADAQVVHGRVLDERGGRPLPAAFVMVTDTSGTRVAGGLTGRDGTFTIQLPGAGTFQLEVSMIGYRTTAGEQLAVGPGETRSLTLRMGLQPIELEGLEAAGERRCREPGSLETARVWEEARKALEITAWSAGDTRVTSRIRRYERQLDHRTLAVEAESETTGDWRARARTYQSLPAEVLAEQGYIVRHAEGGHELFAPDADVILSDAFVDTHCFALEADSVGELIGLGFRPVDDGSWDIEGVLWVDRAAAELRHLEYRYTRLPWRDVDLEEAGGRVEFARLSNGAWVVRRWWIRMPVLQEVMGPPGFGGVRNVEHEVVAVREVGGEVIEVRADDTGLLTVSDLGSVAGRVRNAISGGPLVGADVVLVGTEHTGVTGESGVFRIPGVREGTYDVRIRHPELELLGVEAPAGTVTVERGRGVSLDLATPTGEVVAESFCEPGSGRALVYGRVTDDAGAAVPGARVGAVTHSVGQTWSSGPGGYYAGCVPPTGSTHLLAWPPPTPPWDTDSPMAAIALGEAAVEDEVTRVELDEVGAVRRNLRVARPTNTMAGDLKLNVVVEARADSAAPASGPTRVLGVVRDGTSLRPVAQAQLVLRDADGVVARVLSDAEGGFRLPEAAPGTYELDVQRLGYRPETVPVELTGEAALRLDVRVSVVPVELEGLIAEARRAERDITGYELRRERGLGTFIDAEEIERRAASALSDVLRGLPQLVEVHEEPLFTTSAVRIGVGSCYPALWLDGMLLRPGGPPSRNDPRLPPSQRFRVKVDDVVPTSMVRGIEVYGRSTEVPVRFRGHGSDCGVIAVWTH